MLNAALSNFLTSFNRNDETDNKISSLAIVIPRSEAFKARSISYVVFIKKSVTNNTRASGCETFD